jgi:hypothetical protein
MRTSNPIILLLYLKDYVNEKFHLQRDRDSSRYESEARGKEDIFNEVQQESFSVLAENNVICGVTV